MPALTDGALCQGSTGEFLILVAIVSGGVVIRSLRLWHREELAHAAGIATPIFTSYIGHKRLSFR